MRRVLLIVSLVVLAAFAGISALRAADWPCFRGLDASAAATAKVPAKPKLLWKVKTGGGIGGAAAIVGDRVYVANDSGEVLALRLSDGGQIWKRKVGGGFSGGPLLAEDTVYVGDQEGRVFAMSAADGTMMWERDVVAGKIVGSPAYYKRTILVGGYDDNTLHCVKAGTGDGVWEFKADAQVNCSPCVADGKVMIAGCDGAVHIINADTGVEIAAANEGGKYAASPAYSNGRVFAGSLDGVYLASDMKGKVLWHMQGDDDAGECKSSPAVSPGGTVVFASSANAKVWGVDRDNGKIRWTFQPGDTVESSPVIVTNTGTPYSKIVYFGCNDGAIYGVDLASGKQVWKQTLGGSVTGSPAVAGDRLLIGNSEGTVFCFGR